MASFASLRSTRFRFLFIGLFLLYTVRSGALAPLIGQQLAVYQDCTVLLISRLTVETD